MLRYPRLTAWEEQSIIDTIDYTGYPLQGERALQPLIDRIGNSKIVMLGESTHGTHEYYVWRSRISRRLIEEKGFNFIAVEGDWPDCYRFNRLVKNYESKDERISTALHSFDRWPTWMWANWETTALGEWLHSHNANLISNKKVGFYGLDVYSLWESMESIIAYLSKNDPAMLGIAKKAFECFEPYRRDEGHSYARACAFVPAPCQPQLAHLLSEIRSKIPQYNSDHENVLSVEQNAVIAVNAERYYQSMLKGGASSWNLRDRHMASTLDRLLSFHGPEAKAIVWAHNTHIGDARATDMVNDGMINIGELAREKYGKQNVFLVGFGSFNGTVMAAEKWGEQMQIMNLPDAREGSWEYLLHHAKEKDWLITMDDLRRSSAMKNYIGHRAVGVVYNGLSERQSSYVPSILPERYDAFVFIDNTHALHAMHLSADALQVPETYPFGT